MTSKPKYISLHKKSDGHLVYVNTALIQYITVLDEEETAVVTINTNLIVTETPTEIIRRIYE